MTRANYIAAYVERTQTQPARAIGFGLIAFTVIFGLDLVFHLAHWNWLRERVVCDSLYATLLIFMAQYISRIREALDERRQRQMGYLNHHVRNSLSVITMAEQALNDKKARSSLVYQASREICTVVDQLTHDEEVAIDQPNPATIKPEPISRPTNENVIQGHKQL
jgi:hypothetical protein